MGRASHRGRPRRGRDACRLHRRHRQVHGRTREQGVSLESVDFEPNASAGEPPAERGFTLLGKLALLALCVIVTASVVSRAVWQNVVPDDILLVSELMLIVILAPLPLVTSMREHIAVTVFTERMPARSKHLLGIFGHVIGVAFFCFLAAGFAAMLEDSWRTGEYYEGDLRIPHWLGHGFALLATALVVLRLLVLVIRDIRKPA
ncbi:MAG: TRAP transporter small permease [Proteobacteria bacterium]|nr:MAG: TRAP transporter small permease [Pseudomonadota bacterium]